MQSTRENKEEEEEKMDIQSTECDIGKSGRRKEGGGTEDGGGEADYDNIASSSPLLPPSASSGGSGRKGKGLRAAHGGEEGEKAKRQSLQLSLKGEGERHTGTRGGGGRIERLGTVQSMMSPSLSFLGRTN